MEIVSIFADRLYSFKFFQEELCEFERLFDCWQDAIYLEEFFTQNLFDLQSGFFGEISVEEAIINTKQQARTLEKQLTLLAKNKEKYLDKIFIPLGWDEKYSFQRSKARGSQFKSWLRIYALKIEKGVYAVTGGSIKLTQTMQERHHTKRELNKLGQCLDHLREQGITDIEGFNELFI